MTVSMFSFTPAGAGKMKELTTRWRDEDPGIEIKEYIKCKALEEASDLRPLEQLVQEAWNGSDVLVFFSSAGIAVRSIASLVEHKSKDPAVLVLDERGTCCISLLSGHAGGANELTETISAMLGARPVITTATDVEGKFAVDEFARKNRLVVSDWDLAKKISARVLQGEMLSICSEEPPERWTPTAGMEEHRFVDDPKAADIIISRKRYEAPVSLQLIPRDLTIGLGCRKGTSAEIIEKAYLDFLKDHGLDGRAVESLASIDLKKEEPGLLALAEKTGLPYTTYPPETLMKAEGTFDHSEFVKDTTGADNVCERSAVTAAGEGSELFIKKTVLHGVTLAAAKRGKTKGSITVVGIGPGERKKMTGEAVAALHHADMIIGYRTYIRLLRDLFPELRYRESNMRQEVERAREAFSEAEKGSKIAVISSGDAEVYGMAGLLLEMAEEHPDISVICVPGVTAALSGGALLGAPLGHDYVSISLSDLLTPWEVIAQRLKKAAEGDFVIVLYNPSSQSRKEHYLEACRILREDLSEDTVCGWCRNIGREEEEWTICTLGELPDQPVDMLTTVFIGNKETRVIHGKMVTPRGYRL